MPATVNYTPNSQPKPTLQKNNQIHKSGLHLLHPSLPPKRILSKKILPGGSISFFLGTLSSLYDTSCQDIIEIPAEVVGDYVAWEDLQAFEHSEFEKELEQKVNKKKEYEMMGATVKRVNGRQKKIKENLRGTISRPSRKPAIIMEDLDAKSSKSRSSASSTESHGEIFNRAKGRTRNHKQKLITTTRPGTQWKNPVEDSQQTSSERKFYDPFKSPVVDLIDGDNKKGPKSVVSAQVARRFTPHLPAKRSIALDIDDTDDAENSRLINRQIMNESNMLVDSDAESEERVDLLHQLRDRSPTNLPAQEIPIEKPITPNFRTRTQATSYQNDSSGSTTDNGSELSAYWRSV
ncbi:hypothetical protein MMC29_003992 [Sticta canariensis]|nr:hypothetical protein [Sticta canariensis]